MELTNGHSGFTSISTIIYSVLICVACVGFSVQLGFLISEYRTYPVTLSTISGGTKFVFPDVTICHLGYNPEKLEAGSKIEEALYSLDSRIIRLLNMSNVDARLKRIIREDMSDLIQGVIFSSLDQTSIRIPMEDFIIWCSYGDKNCSSLKINLTPINLMGENGCYTIQISRNFSDAILERVALTLVVYIPPDDFINEGADLNFADVMQDSRGISVTTHSPNSFPYSEDSQINLSPGYTTTIRLSMSRKEMVKTPLKPCHKNLNRQSFFLNHITGRVENYTYKFEDCFSEFYQSFMNRTCGCISEYYPVPATFKQSDMCLFFNMSPINYSQYNNSHNTDLINLLNRFKCQKLHFTKAIDEAEKLCQPSCIYTHYRKSISVTEWPLKNLYTLLWKKLQRHFLDASKSGRVTLLTSFNSTFHKHNSSRLLKESTLKLEIIPESLVANLEIEALVYNLEKLFSDIGGTLGLWIGVSMLSIFDLGSIFYRLVLVANDNIKEKQLAKQTPINYQGYQ